MHALYLNPYYPSREISPEELIERHHASHDWCVGLRSAGVERVSVLQRFHRSTDVSVDGVDYRFVQDGGPGEFSSLFPPRRILAAALALQPDIVHFNGRPFHGAAFRRILPQRTAIVWQHHGGGFPHPLLRPLIRRNLVLFDALLFTATAQADRWRDAGLIRAGQPVHEIPEASTRFRPADPAAAREHLGLGEGRLILWVGHLNRNKDPFTVLSGFARIVPKFPGIRLAMLFASAPLVRGVRAAIDAMSLRANVQLVGVRPHREMERWYSAADLFVSGSHSEGSGFALIESLACGCSPVVTDIPPHRAITLGGSVGVLWKPGDVDGLAGALERALHEPRSRAAVRRFFAEHLSIESLGKAARRAYLSISGDSGRSSSDSGSTHGAMADC